MKGWRGKGADGNIYFRRNKEILRELLNDIKFRVKEEGRQILKEQQRADAITAFGILPKGWTLTDAVKALVDHLAKTTQVLTIPEAVSKFLATKAQKRSAVHVKDWTRRFNRWKATLEPTRTLDSVTTEEIRGYLGAYHGEGRNNERAPLLALFNWAVKVGASPSNPVEHSAPYSSHNNASHAASERVGDGRAIRN